MDPHVARLLGLLTTDTKPPDVTWDYVVEAGFASKWLLLTILVALSSISGDDLDVDDLKDLDKLLPALPGLDKLRDQGMRPEQVISLATAVAAEKRPLPHSAKGSASRCSRASPLQADEDLRAPSNGQLWRVPDMSLLTDEEKALFRREWPSLRGPDGGRFGPDGGALQAGDLLLEVWSHSPSPVRVPLGGARPHGAVVAQQFSGSTSTPTLAGFGKGQAPIYVACGDNIGHVAASQTVEVRAFDGAGLPLDPAFVFAQLPGWRHRPCGTSIATSRRVGTSPGPTRSSRPCRLTRPT